MWQTRSPGNRGACKCTQEAGLRIHAFPIDRVLRQALHTMDTVGEAVVARFGKMNGAGQSAYDILTDADLPWPKFKPATGEEITLDQSAYTKCRESNDRAERKRVLDSFVGTFKTFERSLGVLLYSQLKQDAVYSEVRKYPDSITRTLDAERTPVAVFDTLVAQTNSNLPTLRRYFRLRAKLLGVTDMDYHDV